MYVRYEKAQDLMSEFYKLEPDMRFLFKSDAPPNLKISLVYFIFRLLGKIYYPIHEWFFLKSTSVIDNYVLFGSKDHSMNSHFMPEKTYILLRHELVHLKQRSKNSLWQFRYLFCLPFFFTERAKWEMEAYKETIQATYEIYGIVSQRQISRIVDLFVGWEYLYMRPPWARTQTYQELIEHSKTVRKRNVR